MNFDHINSRVGSSFHFPNRFKPGITISERFSSSSCGGCKLHTSIRREMAHSTVHIEKFKVCSGGKKRHGWEVDASVCSSGAPFLDADFAQHARVLSTNLIEKGEQSIIICETDTLTIQEGGSFRVNSLGHCQKVRNERVHVSCRQFFLVVIASALVSAILVIAARELRNAIWLCASFGDSTVSFCGAGNINISITF